MKKIQLICMGVILAVSLCACAGNSKPVEQNKSASESSVEEKVETDSGKTDEDPGKNTSDDWKKYSSCVGNCAGSMVMASCDLSWPSIVSWDLSNMAGPSLPYGKGLKGHR